MIRNTVIYGASNAERRTQNAERRNSALRKENAMSITSDLLRGHTETIILSRLLRGDSYGYQINKDILERTDNRYELKEATLYSAFKRLEQAGCIRTYWGDETSGARRRYYSITERGRALYEANMRDWAEAKELIDKLLTAP